MPHFHPAFWIWLLFMGLAVLSLGMPRTRAWLCTGWVADDNSRWDDEPRRPFLEDNV